MDPALARFVTDTMCRTIGPGGGVYYNPQSGFQRCGTDNAAFAKLIAQYGAAVAPTAMHTARTTGFGGFELALEGAFTKIDNEADYWQRGTQGPQDPTTKNFSTINKDPASLMQLYQLKISKGFPFGLELTGNLGYLANTSIYTIGADVRMSLTEGFRTGLPAILPEIAVGGSVRTITGAREFQLTVAGFDAQVSKPIPIGGVTVLTPYVGYQWIRIFGDSGLIDLTPNTDAINYCGFTGTNTPATPDPNKSWNDGQPVCTYGTSADFNNNAVFNAVRLTRHRLNFGMQFRFQMIKIGGHFITDLMSPEEANTGADYEIQRIDPTTGNTVTENKFAGVASQWTLAVDIGAIF